MVDYCPGGRNEPICSLLKYLWAVREPCADIPPIVVESAAGAVVEQF